MKRMLSCLLFLLLALSLAAVGHAAGVYAEFPADAQNTLSSARETITLNVVDNKLYVTHASTTDGNNVMAEASEYLLPRSWQKAERARSVSPLTWTFDSAARFENKEVNDVMTSGVIYRFVEQEHNLKLRVYCVVRPELSGPFEFYTELENLNESGFRIAPYEFASFTLNVPDPETTTLFQVKREGSFAENFVFSKEQPMFNGGTGVYTTKFADLTSTNTYAATYRPLGHDDDFLLANYISHNGDGGVYIALEWTHGFLRLTNNQDGTATMKIDMDQPGKYARFFITEIPAGETFLFPSVYLMPYDGSIDDGSNVFKNWFFSCKAPAKLRDEPGEPYMQMDEGGEDEIYLQPLKDIGIESAKWDYGWWSGAKFFEARRILESSWTLLADGLATPHITSERLAAFGKAVEELGMNFTVYLLLHDNLDEKERVTDAYGELNSITHPEWFTSQDAYFDIKLVDLGSESCVAFLKEKLTKFFNNHHIDTWRTDFRPLISESENDNRHDANGTDVMYWSTVGFSELIDHLYENVEGFRYESCDTGGMMKSLYMAQKAVVFNVEDSANYLQLRAAFYDSSYVIHPSQLQFPTRTDRFNVGSGEMWPEIDAPVVASGDTYDFRQAMLDMGWRTTVLGVPMWCGVPKHLDGATDYAALYKEKIRPLVREAELYHILPRPDGVNWDGMMYADPDSQNETKGLVYLFKPSVEAADIQHIVLDGLNEDTLYQLTFADRPEQNCTATGTQLMTTGLDVEIKYIGSELIWITEAE